MEKDASESSSTCAAQPVETTTSSAVSEGWLSSTSNLSVNPIKRSKQDGGRIGFLKVPFRKLFRKPQNLRNFTEKSKKSSKADPSFTSRADEDFVSMGTFCSSEVENLNLFSRSHNCTSDHFGGTTDTEEKPKERKRERRSSSKKMLIPASVSSSSTTPTIFENPSQHFPLLPNKADLRNVQRNIKHLTTKISNENVCPESIHHKPASANMPIDKHSLQLQTREKLGEQEEMNETQQSTMLQYTVQQEQHSLQAAKTELPHLSDFTTLRTGEEEILNSVKEAGLNGSAAPQKESEYSRVKVEQRLPLPMSSAVFCDPGIRTNGSYDVRCGNGQLGREITSQTTAIQVLQDLKIYVQSLTADVQKFKQEQMSLVEPPMLQGLESLNMVNTFRLRHDASLKAAQNAEDMNTVGFDKTSSNNQDALVRTLKDLKTQLHNLHANLNSISRSREESDSSPLELETEFASTLLQALVDLKTRLKEILSGAFRRHRQIVSFDTLETSSQTEVSNDKKMTEPPAKLEEFMKTIYEDLMRLCAGQNGFTVPIRESVSRINKPTPTHIEQVSVGVQCIQRSTSLPGEKNASDSKIENDTACSPFDNNAGFETNTNQSAKTFDQSVQVAATPDPILLKTMEEIRMNMAYIIDELLKRNCQGCPCTTKSDASGMHSSISSADPFLLEILEEIKESVQGGQKEKPVDARPTEMPNLSEVMTALSEIRNSLLTLQHDQKQTRPSGLEQNDGSPQLITNMGDMPPRRKMPNCGTTFEYCSCSASEKDVEDDEDDSGNLTDESFSDGYMSQRARTIVCNDKMDNRTEAQSFTKRPGTIARERASKPQKNSVPGTSGKACKKLARLLDFLDECEDVSEQSFKAAKPHSTANNRRKSRERTDIPYTSTPATSPVLPHPPPAQPLFPPFVTFPTPFPTFTPMGYPRPPPPVLPPAQQLPMAPLSLAQRWYPPLPNTQPLPPPQSQPPHPTYVTGPVPTEGMPKSFTLSFIDNSDDRTGTTISGRKFLCTQMAE
ncbi:unnamed protein product [Schistocephalus solidus]|uniref:Protein kinase domain-containing protein n=1 Tax=Schistocephalus solidus TaxID=70667 RepID=A0A183SJJ1_SCHSO|nr:unnamed protein product [Schistocephalus solidus]